MKEQTSKTSLNTSLEEGKVNVAATSLDNARKTANINKNEGKNEQKYTYKIKPFVWRPNDSYKNPASSDPSGPHTLSHTIQTTLCQEEERASPHTV